LNFETARTSNSAKLKNGRPIKFFSLGGSEGEDEEMSNSESAIGILQKSLVCYPDSDESDSEVIPQTPTAYSSAKNPVLPGCISGICKQKCGSKISEIRRKRLNNEFWRNTYDDRKKWIAACCERNQNEKKGAKKRANINYRLRNGCGESVKVCQKFFLGTLGKKEGRDKLVRTALDTISEGALFPVLSKQGKHAKRTVYDRDSIKEHILSYNPQISHYRRMHAPNRLYLTSDITITSMYNNFIEENPWVSYSVYLKVVREMNISFTKLGQEECETCTKFNFHGKSCPGNLLDCEECLNHSEHKKTYESARESYRKDKEAGKNAFAVDLQKVLLLPHMQEFKAAIFTPRLVTFNETFAPLGGPTSDNPNVAVLWHEATSGRNAGDLASAFWNFFINTNSNKPLILWLDNCSAQNKNWILFSMLIRAVNHFNFPAITLKFFEPGYTFMAADSVHAGIEKQMKKQKDVYDFPQFVNLVEAASKKVNKAISMSYSDFRTFQDDSSSKKLKLIGRPKLAQMYVVQFQKFSKLLFYGLDHEAGDLKHFDFLKKEFCFAIPEAKEKSRGITKPKKCKICQNLLKLMPQSHHSFWKELHENEALSDLLTQQANE